MQQPKDEQPAEEGEKFDQAAAQDAETAEKDFDRAEKEWKTSTPELKDLNVAEIGSLLKILEKALEQGDKQKILALMWQIDQSNPMMRLREWWDRRSSFTQKLLMLHPTSSALFKALATVGFLELKGVSPEEMDKKTDWATKIKIPLQKWGVRIAALFFPEIKPFEPLIQIGLKLQAKGYELSKESRPYLAGRRAEEREKNKIKNAHKKTA
ncbi:hypothetical protein HZC21_06555 [Candidatus Peregrinibacteria bacterium]|nr:hypothetical protein [Candidatus Peregrinibacteria bacterium]